MTREEAQVDEMILEQFDALDADADGKLDEAEFMALDDGSSKKTSPILSTEDFAALDVDGNGMISREEMKMNVELEKEFDEMDENKDESVDQNEVDAFSKKRNNTTN